MSTVIDDIIHRMRELEPQLSSDSKIAESLGVDRSNVYQWRKKDTIPHSALVEWAEIKNISLDWLFNGEGTAEHGTAGNKSTAQYILRNDPSKAYHNQVLEGFECIQVLNIDISAGYGTDVECEEVRGSLAFSTDWLRDKSLKADQLAIVFAKGDSMQPTINSSDALLVDLRPIERITDGIHVIRINDHLYVKRLQSTFTGEVKIISDNTFYEAQTVAPDQLDKLNVIGKVVWIGKEV
ncbi:MAG: transcriptional regulator [Rheinheimera sp.]|nr:transcriptional regulator [Rheinheimera sp.]